MWQAVEGRKQTVFRTLGECRKRGIRPVIVLDDEWVARGYSYLIEYRNRWYYLMHTEDFGYMTESDQIPESVWGVMVRADKSTAEKIICGIYVGAWKLGVA